MTKFLTSVGVKPVEETVNLVVSSLKGKQIHEVIAQGLTQVASLNLGGGGSGPAPAAPAKGGKTEAPKAAPKEEEKPAEDEERCKISSDMEILIKPKSLEKYEHEVGVKGLMVEEAWFGERRLLEEYIVARDSGTAERGDWSQLRDVRVPFRFWTDKSALRLSSGYKPFLYRNAEKLENPYILLM